MKMKIITITVQKGKITRVVPPHFQVRKLKDEMIVWKCDPPREKFLVDFKQDSPFYESQFSNNNPCSGLARRNLLTDTHRTYKYTVYAGSKELDPDGKIVP